MVKWFGKKNSGCGFFRGLRNTRRKVFWSVCFSLSVLNLCVPLKVDIKRTYFALSILWALLCWAVQTQTVKAGTTRKIDTCVYCLKFIHKTHTHTQRHPMKKRNMFRLEKLDLKVVWPPSSSWCPHRQKWMGSFWIRREESCHCHLVYPVSDAEFEPEMGA